MGIGITNKKRGIISVIHGVIDEDKE